MSVSDSGVIGSYLHGRKNDNLGMKGAIVSLETDIINMQQQQLDELTKLGNDIATHIVK